MPNKLAIIIPAYKDTFFDKTLESLSQQTNKNFSVYVGDDNSPYPLGEIVSEYSGKLDIVYQRFETNLGGKDLVQHWNRCLDMLQGEDFFCMFSDDDIMEPTCVEDFYEVLKHNPHYDVFHFDINIINAKGEIIDLCSPYPHILSANDFLYMLYTHQIDARMPEFIFRTKHFNHSGKFINFDLAYRSDNATVIANAKDNGIYTMPKSKILWRNSGINVSANPDPQLKIRRTYASIDFFNWLDDYYNQKKEICPLSPKHRMKLVISDILLLSNVINNKELSKALKRVNICRNNYFTYLRWKFYLTNKNKKTK